MCFPSFFFMCLALCGGTAFDVRAGLFAGSGLWVNGQNISFEE
jgi:hypothetical protein